MLVFIPVTANVILIHLTMVPFEAWLYGCIIVIIEMLCLLYYFLLILGIISGFFQKIWELYLTNMKSFGCCFIVVL